MWGSDLCFSFPTCWGQVQSYDHSCFPPSSPILSSFAWFYIFFSSGQVLLSALSCCSARTSVSEGVSWCIRGERCTPRPPIPQPSCFHWHWFYKVLFLSFSLQTEYSFIFSPHITKLWFQTPLGIIGFSDVQNKLQWKHPEIFTMNGLGAWFMKIAFLVLDSEANGASFQESLCCFFKVLQKEISRT